MARLKSDRKALNGDDEKPGQSGGVFLRRQFTLFLCTPKSLNEDPLDPGLIVPSSKLPRSRSGYSSDWWTDDPSTEEELKRLIALPYG